jgi:hypothetical protein
VPAFPDFLQLEHVRRGNRGALIDLYRITVRFDFDSYFLAVAGQLITTVSGAFGTVSTTALIRNRCPSEVTA